MFVNLCQHIINIVTPEGVVDVPPSGRVARVATTRTPGPSFGPVETVITVFGEVEGLPEPQEGTIFLVSALVQGHKSVRHREDVFSPGEQIRNADGLPVGCRGLTRSV